MSTPSLAPGEVHVWWVPHAADGLPQARRQRVDALLRGVLARYVGGMPAQLQLAREARGRPYLAGAGQPDFNLSDTTGASIVVVGARGRLGVDLERLDRRPDHQRLARRYFAAEEVAELARLDEEDARLAFLRLWTAKEASTKATGTGIFGWLPHWRFAVSPDAPTLLSPPADAAPASRWHHLRLCPAPPYTAVIACDGYRPTVRGFLLESPPD